MLPWLANLSATTPGRIDNTIEEFEKINSNFKNAAWLNSD
jgi:hypothetical protein